MIPARPVAVLRANLLHRHLVPLSSNWSSSIRMASSNSTGAEKNTPSGKDITAWASKDGEFRRQASQFRNFISSKPGARFPPESGRYHLIVSYACPWAHRTLIVRALKGLERHIGVTAVHWHMGEKGWRFVTRDEHALADDQWEAAIGGDKQWVQPDPLAGHEGYTHLRDVYFGVEPKYEGRFTVPTLFDTKEKTIVSNESAEIIRMFYREFDGILDEPHRTVDLLPADLEGAVDAANEWIYPQINNGVYRSGFATAQGAYEKAVREVFAGLDRAEAQLASSGGPYWFGDRLTEVDVRLFTTIIRFDAVYVQHFKTNLADIRSGYPHLHRWVRNLYWNFAAFRDTTNFTHIKRHYTRSHSQINPHAITPLGPLPDILPLDKEVRAAEAVRGGKAI